MTHRTIGRLATVFLILLLAGITSVQAQGRQRGPAMHKDGFVEQNLTAINEAVDLDEDQTTAITELLGGQFDAQTELRNGPRGEGRVGMRAMRQRFADIGQETDTAILALLGDEQKPKFTALREAQAAQRQNRRRGGRPGGSPGPQ